LNQYSCPKVLIHTTLSNHEVQKFADTDIIVFKIGYQLLPKYFYNFFREKNQIQQRRYDSKEIKEDLKMKIQTLMATIIHWAICHLTSITNNNILKKCTKISLYFSHNNYLLKLKFFFNQLFISASDCKPNRCFFVIPSKSQDKICWLVTKDKQ